MSSIAETTDIKDLYLSQFANMDLSNDPLADLRKSAILDFEELGFPTTRWEDWKYSRVKPIVNQAYEFNGADITTTSVEVNHFLIAGKEVNLLVFVNGVYNSGLSNVQEIQGLKVSNLEEHASDPSVQKHFGKYASTKTNPFTALNTALFKSGALIEVAANTEITKPVHIVYLNKGIKEKVAAFPRTLILVGKSSKVQVIESYHSLNADASLTVSVTEIVAGENANVDLYKAQLEDAKANHINITQVDQERDSNCAVHTITLGGGFVRNNLNYLLNGTNCETHMYGLYVLNGKQHVDNQTFVDHAHPHCYSNELYKGIMDNQSTGVFNGKIMVRPDAQKTNAFQTNSNILLSDDASMNAKPQLEIFADDVKCSHGATTGQIDPEQLFYLRARGIDKDTAMGLLITAFANEVLNNVKNEVLKENLTYILTERLSRSDIK